MYLERLKTQTRWNDIPGTENGYRLLCSDPVCSLSCANLRNGRLSVTSIHGQVRHSYLFTKKDMVFTIMKFMETLTSEELSTIANVFNKVSQDHIMSIEKLI